MSERKASRITRKERDQLIEAIAGHTNSQRENLLEQKPRNWSQIRRYVGLIGLMGALNLPEIKSREIAHTKKMIGLEAVSINEKPRRPKGAGKFWKEVRAEAGEEITAASVFRDELSKMPRAYREASKDLQLVKGLVEDPLILALQQSVRAVRPER